MRRDARCRRDGVPAHCNNMFDSWLLWTNNQEYQTYLAVSSSKQRQQQQRAYVLSSRKGPDKDLRSHSPRTATLEEESQPSMQRDRTCTERRGRRLASFLAAASMDAAAPSSSFSAITVGSSGSSWSVPANVNQSVSEGNIRSLQRTLEHLSSRNELSDTLSDTSRDGSHVLLKFGCRSWALENNEHWLQEFTVQCGHWVSCLECAMPKLWALSAVCCGLQTKHWVSEDTSGISRAYLAGGQHVRNGLATHVGCYDNIVLLATITGSHSLGGGLCNGLGTAHQVFGSGSSTWLLVRLQSLVRWWLSDLLHYNPETTTYPDFLSDSLNGSF